MEELPKAHEAEAKRKKEYWHFHRNLFSKVSRLQVTKIFMDLEQSAKDP
jgi:protein-disulfide isomerase